MAKFAFLMIVEDFLTELPNSFVVFKLLKKV